MLLSQNCFKIYFKYFNVCRTTVRFYLVVHCVCAICYLLYFYFVHLYFFVRVTYFSSGDGTELGGSRCLFSLICAIVRKY